MEIDICQCYEKLLSRLEALLLNEKYSKERFFLGITGPPASGKSTLTEWLVEALNSRQTALAASLSMDGFHLTNTQLEIKGLTNRKGSPETFNIDDFIYTIDEIKRLRTKNIYIPVYSRLIHDVVQNGAIILPETRCILIEGNYLLLEQDGWKNIKYNMMEIWYLEIKREVAEKRLYERHLRGGKTSDYAAWKTYSIDMINYDIVEKSKNRADLIINCSCEKHLEEEFN